MIEAVNLTRRWAPGGAALRIMTQSRGRVSMSENQTLETLRYARKGVAAPAKAVVQLVRILGCPDWRRVGGKQILGSVREL